MLERDSDKRRSGRDKKCGVKKEGFEVLQMMSTKNAVVPDYVLLDFL